jgi:hypothetical protein
MGFMAAVLLGVVELWLSQGRPDTARTGVWGFDRTNLRAPNQAFAEKHTQEPRSGPRSSSSANTPTFSCRPSTMFSPLPGTEPGAGHHCWRSFHLVEDLPY